MMKFRDTNIIDRDKQEVDLDNLRFDAAGKFWYDDQDHEISPDQMLGYAMRLEAENSWMRREVERVGHAIFTGEDGYVGTEEDLHAIGQFVEGICETLERMPELEELQVEIEPYALRLEPNVVMYKSTVGLRRFAEWLEEFLTIMRRGAI